jgi:hypothetical protein
VQVGALLLWKERNELLWLPKRLFGEGGALAGIAAHHGAGIE